MKKSVLFIITILFSFTAIFAQLKEETERPKIGLVLSGGGAKGLAHIGVIKVLEEAGIRPDYITGTSMGSIIGGLYASGYSAAQMDSIVRQIDWSVVLSDQVPLTDVLPVEKGDYNRFQLEFDVTKSGFKIPSGVVKGQRISELMSQLTWHVSDIEDFDELPIPFRCVAADLITGKTHVFDSGDLMLAMRSSMAIPSIFTPVAIDSMYLVDGGVLDNFPVKVALDMGADIIIGVNVGFKDYPTVEDMNSLPKVLLSAASIGSNPALLEAIKLSDYLINPVLEPYTTSSFTEGIAIMERGETAARKQFDTFKHLADSLNTFAPQAAQVEIPQKGKIVIDEIDIRNRKNISLNFFYNNLGFESGDTISTEQINEGMRRLIGTRFYKKITYEINKENGKHKLIFYTQEATPAMAKFSLRYDNELKAGIVANLTFRNFLIKNSRLSMTGDISEDPRFSGNLITYIGEKQKLGLLTDIYFEKTPLPIYKDNNKKHGTFNYYNNRASIGAFFTTKRFSMMTLKAHWNEVLVTQRSGLSEVFDHGIERFGNGFLKGQAIWEVNTLNKRFFANRGSLFKLSLSGNISSYELYKGQESSKALIKPYTEVPYENYFSGLGTFQKHFALSKTLDLSTQVSAGGFSHDAPFFEMYKVGGTMYNKGIDEIPFAGLNYREKIIENFGLARVELHYKIGNVFYGDVIVNALYAANFGNNRFSSIPITVDPHEFIFGASAGIAINSIIGPIAGGIGTNASDFKPRVYVSIGYPFH